MSQLRVEIHPSHLVLAWGEASPSDVPDRYPTDKTPVSLPTVDTLQDSVAAHQRRLDEINRLLDLVVTELNRNSAHLETTTALFARRIDTVERRNDERWRAVGRGFHDWYLKHALAQATSASGILKGE
jgi:hypothetical protein